jgi:hypothetical protein
MIQIRWQFAAMMNFMVEESVELFQQRHGREAAHTFACDVRLQLFFG